MTETLAQRTERMRRDAATAAQAEVRRQAALDAASAAPRAPLPASPAPSIIPSSAAPAAAQPASDPGAVHQAEEGQMSNNMSDNRKRLTIELSQPVMWFNKSISSVVLREPSAADFFTFGEPRVVVSNSAGMAWGEVPDAMKSYLDKYLDVDCGFSFLTELGIKDGKAIKEALFSFFREEAKVAPE